MTKKTEKFLFNLNNFDEGPVMTTAEIIEEELEPEEELPPPPPTFSEEELEAAKKQAFQEGEQKGTADTNQKHDQQKQQTLQQIADQLPALLIEEENRIKQYEQDSLTLCYALFKKIAPALLSATQQQALFENIKNIIKHQNTITKIEIQAHPDQIPPLSEELKTLQNAENLSLTANQNIPMGTCQINWPSGGASYSHEQLITEIERELTQILTDNSIEIPSHTNQAEKQENNNAIEDSPQAEECDTMQETAPQQDQASIEDNNSDGDNP